MLLLLVGIGVIVATIWIGEVVLDAAETRRDQALQRAVGETVEGAFRELETGPPATASGAGAAEGAGNPVPPPCDAYHDCCVGYLAALRQVEGDHQETIDATAEACEAIDRMRSEPDAADTCRVMLDALRLGVEAWRGTPGFVEPLTCR